MKGHLSVCLGISFFFFFDFGGQGKGDQGKVVEWRRKGEEKSSRLNTKISHWGDS